MTVHGQDATGGATDSRLRRMTMRAAADGALLITSSGLRPSLTATRRAVDLNVAQAHLNGDQARMIFNPSDEEDSLLEHVVALLRPDESHASRIEKMRRLLGDLWKSNLAEARTNHAEGQMERDVADVLGDAVRRLHVEGIRSALTVKEATRRLRAPLRVIDRARTEVVPAREYGPAVRQVDAVIAALPAEVLRGNGLRHELGKGPHDVLLSLLTDGAEASS